MSRVVFYCYSGIKSGFGFIIRSMWIPCYSPVHRSNFSAAGVILATLIAIYCNLHAKPSGAYRGAIGPLLAETNEPVSAPSKQSSKLTTDDGLGAAGLRIDGRLALRLKQSLLIDAKAKLLTIPDYLVTFVRQERVGKRLLGRETCELKLKHAPFQVYLKWMDGGDVGREVLYREGENDGKLIVSPANMVPVLRLVPDGDIAMRECRHPITEAGILNLVQKLMDSCERDLKLDEGVACQFLPERKFEGRSCLVIRTDYTCPEIDAVYRSSILFIDRELAIPVFVKNYGWSQNCDAPESANEELNEDTLLELYAYTGLRCQSRLSSAEFDTGNKDYRFQRK